MSGVVIVIPARFASTRYPGKPLVELRGATGEARSLIRRSWDAAMEVAGIDRVIVATDDERIAAHAHDFGADVAMTSTSCRNGTERCAEAVENLGLSADIVVNLQGDAPLTPAWFIEDLVAGLRADATAGVATPVLPTSGAMRQDLIADRHAGRVGGTTAVFAADMGALYFSKEVIPFAAGSFDPAEPSPVFHHVGVYAYRPDALKAYPTWAEGPLERLEGLEQLRFLENGRRVLCVRVEARGRQFWELNNPEDVPRLERMMADMSIS
ncbi:3-deoxy-manno-octulosonate cytidylyltransferase (plasmid) [Paracoccus sp. TK19116]|uniref:3-deoxy-manno-octulosonate cytidylyltransferase n=1 Tax=Paracoccus albicereus TaxID=2922394 RepID=A0ABT1MLT9_9RHOB|nr:manno-octulosonate cytidylyltransferase [Paracoccus albicereus]MCQ0969248.1 3-deoxy-manno-octulosonate cytidylyltransferase [Paracoccus albicereus]